MYRRRRERRKTLREVVSRYRGGERGEDNGKYPRR